MAGEKIWKHYWKQWNPSIFRGLCFVLLIQLKIIDLNAIVMLFKEEEATTIILKRMGWIKPRIYFCYGVDHITVHSSLEAVGLTAAFSNTLSQETSVAM
jgi:hypothetical protein